MIVFNKIFLKTKSIFRRIITITRETEYTKVLNDSCIYTVNLFTTELLYSDIC